MPYEVHHKDAVAKFIIVLENKIDKVVVKAKKGPTSKVEEWVSL